MIDYHDIISASVLKIPNEDAADHAEKFVQKNYRFIYLLQIEVSTINGLSVIDKSPPAPETTEDQTYIEDGEHLIDKSPAPETTYTKTPSDTEEHQQLCNEEPKVDEKPKIPSLGTVIKGTDHSIHKRSNTSLANLFFKVSSMQSS